MIPAADFGPNVEAHLRYILALPPDEAGAAFRARLADGSWRQAPRQALHTALVLDGRSDAGEREALLPLLAREIVGKSLNEVREELPQLLQSVTQASRAGESRDPLLDDLVAWIKSSAEVGDQTLVADIFQRTASLLSIASRLTARRDELGGDGNLFEWVVEMPGTRTEEEADRALAEVRQKAARLSQLRPLALWLLRNGASELRRKERGDVLAWMVECLGTDFGPVGDELEVALRYLAMHPKGEGAAWRRHRDVFWAAVESTLHENAAPSLVGELVVTLYKGRWSAEDCTEPLHRPELFPRSARAVLQALGEGRFLATEPLLRHVAWRRVCGLPFDLAPVVFAGPAVVKDALERLGERTGDDQPLPPNHGPWLEHIMLAFLRLHGLGPAALKELLDPRRPFDEVHALRALRIALDEAEPNEARQLARRVLAEDVSIHSRLQAILALDLSPPVVTARTATDRLAGLQRHFQSVMDRPWLDPIFGIRLASWFDGRPLVQFEDLPGGDLVHAKGDKILLNRLQYEEMAGGTQNDDEFLANATLYFLHELIHARIQGIGRKSAVEKLRAAGGETNLLHLDLSADHAAAMLASRAVPRWSLEWLKDLQGKSLLGYTAGRAHATASRERKATRLVSLRLDVLARSEAAPPAWRERLGDGYVFVEFSPGGGAMLAFVCGPPMSVIDHTNLEPADAAFFHASMDAGVATLARVDELDERLRLRFFRR